VTSERRRQAAIDRVLERSSPASNTPVGESCLDPESIAAWTEGGLSTAESAAVESHLSDCARCQVLLSTLLRSAPAPAPSESAWSRWQLRWLVPLTAAATAVALWVAIPDEPSSVPTFKAAQRVQSVEEPPVEAPAAPAATLPEVTFPAPVRGFEGAEPSARSRVNETAANEVATNEADSSVRDDATAQLAAPVTGAPREEETRRETAATEGNSAAVIARGETAASAPATSPLGGTAQGGFRALRTVPAIAPFEIASPNPNNRWRVAAGGGVEFSATGGASWQAANVPPGTPMGGSAPQSLICWLVGRAGFVALTTDGLQFRRISFPEAVDLSSVRASDDSAAIVTTADGRLYRTQDAGASWTSMSP
jgi:hypothetical protein